MLLFLDISGGEILLILLAGMLLFGKDKLPGIIRGVAKGSDFLRKASEEVKQQINAETGLGDTIDDIRQSVDKAASDLKQDIRDMASETDQSLEEITRDLDETTEKLKQRIEADGKDPSGNASPETKEDKQQQNNVGNA